MHSPDPSSRSGWSVLELLIVLARRRNFILMVTFGVAALTAVVSMLLPVRYTAASSILPPQQSPSGAAFLAQMAGSQGLGALAGSSLGIKSQADTYLAMFTSRTVEDAMIERFALMKAYKVRRLSEARKVFEKRSTAVAGAKDGIIRVTVDGPTPDQAASMANAYVEEFQKLAANVATTEAGQRRLFFDRQLEEAKNNLSSAEQDLKRTELTTGMVQPDNQSRAMIEAAATIQGQIVAKQVQIRALSSSATNDNPEMIVLQQQLAALQSQLAQLTGSSASTADFFVPKGKVPAAALDYIRKLREVKYRETIFEALASQFQLAKLDEAKQGAVFQVIDRAVPPDTRSSPHRTVLVILCTMLAFVFACLAVWTQATFQMLRADPEDGDKISTLLQTLRSPPEA